MILEQALMQGEAEADHEGVTINVTVLNYEGVDLPGNDKYAMYIMQMMPRKDFTSIEDINFQLDSYGVPSSQLDWHPVLEDNEDDYEEVG